MWELKRFCIIAYDVDVNKKISLHFSGALNTVLQYIIPCNHPPLLYGLKYIVVC